MKDAVFFDVDTQYDFMHKSGRFYVPVAEKIIPNLKKITQFAKKNNIKVIASKDNCIVNGSCANPNKHQGASVNSFNGCEKIPETMMADFLNVATKKMNKAQIMQLKGKGSLLMEKESHSIFSNPNLKPILNGTKKAYVYGVATDYCVKAAVIGLRKMSIDTYVIKDAIKPIFKENEKKYLDLFRQKGAKFLTTNQLLKRKEL